MTQSLLASADIVIVPEADWPLALAESLSAETGATVTSAESASEARSLVQADQPDLLVIGYDLADGDGMALLESIRQYTTTLPVVLLTTAGNESLASDAIELGVTDYVCLDPAGGIDETAIRDRLDRAIRAGRRQRTQRDRARQFDALFHDDDTATWVLDPTGTIRRANGAARDLAGESIQHLVDRPFWEQAWLQNGTDLQRDAAELVESAIGGTASAAVFQQDGQWATRQAPPAQPEQVTPPQLYEVSAQPVETERGEIVSVIVEAVEVTDRVTLERELRQSEELHRVTLSNMTDTILITDEDGTYTYVCPNVHFIFGYTAAEIYEMGTIDELIGADLFDREELAEEGVLKNIECTATDKAGNEHTLLVNVREVEIQGGTLLYSCRDVTARKQREEALATLQETARGFLYAETQQEIAQAIVDNAAGVVGVEASAVYLFDADTNDLRPAAHSPTMNDLHGPLPTVHADGQSLPSYSFVEDDALFFTDVHTADRLQNQATALRSVAYIPLGNHGVFVAGTDEVGYFDDVARELTDLLAATAEAALDRVARETRLREQDRQLQRQNEQLTALNRINDTIREIDQALLQAETQEEIDHTVCERLTADDRFRFAWIGAADRNTDELTVRAKAGDDDGYLDRCHLTIAPEGVEPAGITAATGEETFVSNVAAELREEPWRKEAVMRDYLSVLSIPLVYNDLSHGVLTVYADTQDAFDETARAVLRELGETIAAARSAIERKHALLTATMNRLEFAVTDDSFVLARLAREADCPIAYDGGVQQTAEGSYLFCAVECGDVAGVAETAAGLPGVADAHAISSDDEQGVLRLELTQPFVALDLAEHGAIVRSVRATPTETTLVVDVPASIDTRKVQDLLADRFESVTVRAKHQLEDVEAGTPPGSILADLTERQLEVVQTAYYSGFFDAPRETTGEDVAEMLDISPPAFYQHVRTVERKVFAALFDDATVSSPETRSSRD